VYRNSNTFFKNIDIDIGWISTKKNLTSPYLASRRARVLKSTSALASLLAAVASSRLHPVVPGITQKTRARRCPTQQNDRKLTGAAIAILTSQWQMKTSDLGWGMLRVSVSVHAKWY
jgi:hypothetical protein